VVLTRGQVARRVIVGSTRWRASSSRADPEDFARRWHILMKGSIVAAGEGDHEAARRAQSIGKLLLASERAGAAT